MIDTSGMTPEEIQVALEQLQREAARHSAKQDSLRAMDSAIRDRLQQEGIGPGRSWVEPEDPSDAYPLKWVVQHQGRFYVSRASVNMDTPGDSEKWEEAPPSAPLPSDGEGDKDDATRARA